MSSDTPPQAHPFTRNISSHGKCLQKSWSCTIFQGRIYNYGGFGAIKSGGPYQKQQIYIMTIFFRLYIFLIPYNN
jgi:hypothetical protein